MLNLEIDLSDINSIAQHVICSKDLTARRETYAAQVSAAYDIILRFAEQNGWEKHLLAPLFNSIEVFASQGELWSKLRLVSGSREKKLPAEGLSAAICESSLMILIPEEYRKIRPEYNVIDKAWTRLIAHEMAHQLHIRVIGAEEKMGPKWFYEGFAMYVAGQQFGHQITSAKEAIEATKAESRESYPKYVAAFEFFIKDMNLESILQRASDRDFEAWLTAHSGGIG